MRSGIPVGSEVRDQGPKDASLLEQRTGRRRGAVRPMRQEEGMIIYRRSTMFGKSQHIAEVHFDPQDEGLTFLGTQIGPRGGGVPGATTFTLTTLAGIMDRVTMIKEDLTKVGGHIGEVATAY